MNRELGGGFRANFTFPTYEYFSITYHEGSGAPLSGTGDVGTTD